MQVLVAGGERIGVDGAVVDGAGELDTSLITGETVPQRVARRASACSPARSISASPLRLRVRAVGEGTLLAEIVRLMELAEQRRSRFVAMADRVARAYAPAVHGLALRPSSAGRLPARAPGRRRCSTPSRC